MKNFITIEGCDGVGKTHQTAMLKEYCVSSGQSDVVFTREPGGSKVAEKIREIILDAKNTAMTDLTEAFLYASARAQHLNDIVIPALREGKTVVCDRFVDSSYVYQGFGRGLGYEKVKRLNDIAVGEYMPEYTFFLDLAPSLAFKRKGGGDKKDRLEICAPDFYNKVYKGYQTLIRENPARFVVIDASGTREQTHHRLVGAMREKGIIK